MPCDTVAAEAVEPDAALAGLGIVLTPKVVIQDIVPGLDGSPLAARVGALGDCP